ncbi:MAG TPA: bifunctional alpha,alpha-trehalose-phosphate synthase (UDP-forming)/trehalose-phosphatase, partial [Candidatus Krumholzibacteria bacterium]|nr:bifunctional alpha,alpha-trehalose-phosphate synthase (UDP-forming)/trehalose-phosphatase [Candidatus Krumholzibacteria bacterium]
MKRLLIVSNRLPVTVESDGDKLAFQPSVGGLASGLGSYLDSTAQRPETLWIGWPGLAIPREQEVQVTDTLAREHGAVPVFINAETMSSFYEGFCNDTLWPLFHYFPSYAVFKERSWNDYRRVNKIFCDAVVREVKPGDVVWVHDYQLLLLPRMLKEKLPDTPVGFFLHIPFPSFEVFRILPARWRDVILDGMLGADLIGFHTHEYAHYFLRCVLRILGHDHTLGRILVRDHVAAVDAFPMGIDYQRYHEAAAAPGNVRKRDALRANLGDRKMVISVDRLDYSKGILNRLRGYEHFLRTCPQWRKRVMMALVLVPSREGVEQYRSMKRQIDETVGRINGRYGSLDWTPISYQYTSLDFDDLVAFYAAGDVALVTPLRDGMNLVAKEYVAACVDQRGVLILSEMAGAARELGEAITINPITREEISQALETALEMPDEEQAHRLRDMQERLQKQDVRRWAKEFLERLEHVTEQQKLFTSGLMSAADRVELVTNYHRASRRLLLLDYDGTLVPFRRRPEAARPSPELLDTLRRIANRKGTELALVSGRPRDFLSSWFDDPAIHIVAEHGAWVRRAGGKWKLTRQLRADWKQQVLPMLRRATDRLPGSFVEEKDYSLVWHYRQADPETALTRAQELADGLVQFTANMDLLVVPGHRTVEVRDAAISKAHAAMEFLGGQDFVMGVGDDTTDEDMFRALPANAYSIRVGLVATHARFNVPGYEDVL